MARNEGDKLPEGTLLQMTEAGPAAVDLAQYATGRVAIFALPGAYTGTCTTAHVPSFIRTADKFRAKGVDRIVCVSVNDPFVMGAWAASTGADKAGLTFLGDADGSFTKALGLDIQADGWVKGRSKRYAMLVNDGTVEALEIEESPGTCALSSGDSLLGLL